MILQDGPEPAVAAPEAGQDVVESGGHLVVGQREDALDDARRPGLAVAEHLLAGEKQPGDDPAGVGAQPVWRPRRQAPLGRSRRGLRGHGWPPMRRMPCWSVEIRAMVDSAPWLSLRPSRSRPS